MPAFDLQNAIQANGNYTLSEWCKNIENPGFLQKFYVLPSVQSNLARRAVLGAYLAQNVYPAPGKLIQINLMPACEAKNGLGMYGNSDLNLSIQRVAGHKGSPVTQITGKADVYPGERIPDSVWQTIGTDKIAFDLYYKISITKKYDYQSLALSDVPNAVMIAMGSLMNAQQQLYEDIFVNEFVAIGTNLNREYLNGDLTRPVCATINDVTSSVNLDFSVDSTGKSHQNPFTLLTNNLMTWAQELDLDSFSTELIVAPIFMNNLKASANWVNGSLGYTNTLQSQEMRYGIQGQLVNGMPVFVAPRLSARYGAATYEGKNIPDFFLIDRSKILIPKCVFESLHLVPAPTTFFTTILIKSLEFIGIYAQPITIEDYQAQSQGQVVRSAAINYGYLTSKEFTGTALAQHPLVTPDPAVEGIYTTQKILITGTWTGGPVTGDTLGVQIDKILVAKGSTFSDATVVNADGVRVWVPGKGIYDDGGTVPANAGFNFTLKLGIVSRFYNFDPNDLTLDSNLTVRVYFTIGGASSYVDVLLENVYTPSGL